MDGKLTLITPPDIFENDNESILFVHLSDEEQDAVSMWLAAADIKIDINLYVYNGEPNLPWLLYAMNLCKYTFINIDESNYITQAIGGYMLGKNQVIYKVSDENLAAVYSHINQNRVTQIEQFLERIFNDKAD